MPRVHFKRRIKKRNLVIIITIFIMIGISSIFKYINNVVTPLLLNYASIEVSKISSIILNQATKENINNLNINNLFILVKENDLIKTIDFNSLEVNNLLTDITSTIQNSFKKIELGEINSLNIEALNSYNQDNLKKGIIYEIPSGIVSKNPLLSNLGPKIPVRISLYGEIISKVNTKITNYGINNALIEVSIDINMNTRVLLPFTSKVNSLSTNIPIAIKLIEGKVPEYYGMSGSSNSFSIPLE